LPVQAIRFLLLNFSREKISKMWKPRHDPMGHDEVSTFNACMLDGLTKVGGRLLVIWVKSEQVSARSMSSWREE
jgi:hypothetical protein